MSSADEFSPGKRGDSKTEIETISNINHFHQPVIFFDMK